MSKNQKKEVHGSNDSPRTSPTAATTTSHLHPHLPPPPAPPASLVSISGLLPVVDGATPLKFGLLPYSCWIPSTSSRAKSTFLVRVLIVGYITASATTEWPIPSRCPISCTATDSRSTAVSDDARVTSPSATHASAASRWNRPSVGENACANVPNTPSNGSPSPCAP